MAWGHVGPPKHPRRVYRKLLYGSSTAHAGTIVAAKAPEGGAVFTISLPAPAKLRHRSVSLACSTGTPRRTLLESPHPNP
jgi:hypothetical protein